jgi:uncharacterized integral membrane protein (TIGR00698 family)
VIEKMLRVMMLAPFLLLLSASQSRHESGGHAGSPRMLIPWFALLFIGASAVNSLQLLPAGLVDALLQLDTLILAMAMAALGLRTHIGAIQQAGVKPLLLAATLFAFLVVGGYAVNRIVAQLLSA